MHQALGKLLADYEGQFDYVAVASTRIINNGILNCIKSEKLRRLGGISIKLVLQNIRINRLVYLNDAQAATYAEYQLQNSEQVSNFIFITVSAGVGGGIVLNQNLQTGSRGIAGHIGHTLADQMVRSVVVGVEVGVKRCFREKKRKRLYFPKGSIAKS